jgi:dTDP-4-amino-4,6-dideoxygalactose transaminase
MKKKIYYGLAVYNHKEINAVINVLKNKQLTLIDGPLVKKFEEKVARLFGKKICINGKLGIFG